MKKPNCSFPPSLSVALVFGAASTTQPLPAASLYSEPFDSQATAKVLVNKLANADLVYVDYAALLRDQPGGGGPVTLSIPEAPNRIPGSAPRRGVLLNATYGGTARTINLLASATPGGAARVFSGDYRMAFDMWLAVDRTSTVGTTEVGIFGIGHSGAATVSYARRTTGVGTFGWASAEGGIGASGDMALYVGITPAFVTENLANPGLYGLAFPQGAALKNTPNNQWTQVEIITIGDKVTVFLNGVKFGVTTEPAITNGFASIGYEDPFTGSTPGGLNKQFGLFDNLTLESLPGAPSLEASPLTVIPVVDTPLVPTAGDFIVTNLSATTAYTITSGLIDGPDAGSFSFSSGFPLPLPALGEATVGLNFNPATPNGLKVARLILTTTDPNLPQIRLPLQALRAINSVEAALSLRVASVSVENGTGSGELTVTNNSTADVSLSAPTKSGLHGAMFAVTGVFPKIVAAGAEAILPVVFTPTGTKGLKSGVLDFVTNDPGVPTLSVSVAARYAFGPPLLAQYKMDDTAGTTLVDSTGVSPAAALQIREAPFGFSQPSLLPGGAGTSVRLTPADTSASGNFAISNAVHLPNVSYSLWIKPEPKEAGIRRILHRSSLFTTKGTLYSLYLTPTGQLVFEVNSLTAVESADGVIMDNTVYHVAVTHSDLNGFENSTGTPTATRTRLFINGVQIAESIDPVAGFTDYTLTTTSEGLYIGTATSAGQGYIGLMDDLQVYSVELTPEQITGMFSQPGRNAFELVTLDYKITSVQYDPATSKVTLVWNSAAGAVYSVQQSTTTTGFTDVPGQANIPSGGVGTSATFTASAGPRQFFQIRRKP